ncbi:glycosyltransferase family 2 protein [Marinobacter salinexigens]|uniref:Glycosyltransferase family 2 protein n=1 Tax=Marinobacter salinexigens TaxID=2919747 RepID=A0A5B0VKM0_9GAMM|nr:glycosyltransferase [Marinobacter salinexigens]KAA1174655.1 glycosyltransferase family 2 protein [Marinobacter salinexigens]
MGRVQFIGGSPLPLCRNSILSILLQTRTPDKINLWISEEAYLFDQGILDRDPLKDLLNSCSEKLRDIVSVRWVNNIGPYRKLLPILREADSGDIIVTADDDILYGKDWLGILLDGFKSDPSCAVAARVRREKVNFFGKKTSYLRWGLVRGDRILDDNYIITFGGGAVVTRSMFLEDDISDEEYKRLAPTSDDLWYSELLKRNLVKVRVLSRAFDELELVDHEEGLMRQNLPATKNYLHKIKVWLIDYTLGYFGYSMCNNDLSYSKIKLYFRGKNNA